MCAMRRWEAGDVAGMEQDLRQVLDTDPNNAEALNALGYTLLISIYQGAWNKV